MVVHSLGNFVFDMDFQTKTMEGIFVEIVLWGDQVKAVEPVPYTLDSRFVPRVVKGDRARGSWTTCGRPVARSVRPSLRHRLCSQAHITVPTRSSWRRSTTSGVSPGEW